VARQRHPRRQVRVYQIEEFDTELINTLLDIPPTPARDSPQRNREETDAGSTRNIR